MNLIGQVSRLKEQAGRLDAIKARQRETGKPNHALLERIDIERGLANAAPAMLEALGGFRPGDADLLKMVPCFRTDGDCDKCSSAMKAACDAIERMQAMAARMEEQ